MKIKSFYFYIFFLILSINIVSINNALKYSNVKNEEEFEAAISDDEIKKIFIAENLTLNSPKTFDAKTVTLYLMNWITFNKTEKGFILKNNSTLTILTYHWVQNSSYKGTFSDQVSIVGAKLMFDINNSSLLATCSEDSHCAIGDKETTELVIKTANISRSNLIEKWALYSKKDGIRVNDSFGIIDTDNMTDTKSFIIEANEYAIYLEDLGWFEILAKGTIKAKYPLTGYNSRYCLWGDDLKIISLNNSEYAISMKREGDVDEASWNDRRGWTNLTNPFGRDMVFYGYITVEGTLILDAQLCQIGRVEKGGTKLYPSFINITSNNDYALVLKNKETLVIICESLFQSKTQAIQFENGTSIRAVYFSMDFSSDTYKTFFNFTGNSTIYVTCRSTKLKSLLNNKHIYLGAQDCEPYFSFDYYLEANLSMTQIESDDTNKEFYQVKYTDNNSDFCLVENSGTDITNFARRIRIGVNNDNKDDALDDLDKDKNDKKGLKTYVIVLIVVLSVLFVAGIVGVLVYFFVFKRKNNKKENEDKKGKEENLDDNAMKNASQIELAASSERKVEAENK